MGTVVDVEGEELHLGTYTGTVLDNADPLKLARVKVVVPGFLEAPGVWAWPVGGSHSNGAKGEGSYDVPPKGATVNVEFKGGNIDRPEYSGAWHGKGEQLSAGPSDPKDAHKIKVYESARFLIVLNGIGGAEELLVRDKTTGDEISMKPERTLVKASQKVTVNAPQVELAGDDLAATPLITGVVRADGIDTLTGLSYGALGAASSKVTVAK